MTRTELYNELIGLAYSLDDSVDFYRVSDVIEALAHRVLEEGFEDE